MTITIIRTQKKYTLPCYVSIEIAADLNLRGKPQKLRKNRRNLEVMLLNYANVPKDVKGWIDAGYYLPQTYDICTLMFEDERRRAGWWSGSSWFCRGMDWKERVIKWRRREEGH